MSNESGTTRRARCVLPFPPAIVNFHKKFLIHANGIVSRFGHKQGLHTDKLITTAHPDNKTVT